MKLWTYDGALIYPPSPKDVNHPEDRIYFGSFYPFISSTGNVEYDGYIMYMFYGGTEWTLL